MCVYVRIPAAAWPWRLLVCVYYCCLVFAVTLFAAIIVLYLFVSVWLAVHRMCRNVNCCCCFYCIRLFVYKHMNSYNIHIRNTYVCMHGVVVYTRYVIVFVMFVVPHQWPVCCCFCFLPSACLFYFFCVHRHRRSSFVIFFLFFFLTKYIHKCVLCTHIFYRASAMFINQSHISFHIEKEWWLLSSANVWNVNEERKKKYYSARFVFVVRLFTWYIYICSDLGLLCCLPMFLCVCRCVCANGRDGIVVAWNNRCSIILIVFTTRRQLSSICYHTLYHMFVQPIHNSTVFYSFHFCFLFFCFLVFYLSPSINFCLFFSSLLLLSRFVVNIFAFGENIASSRILRSVEIIVRVTVSYWKLNYDLFLTRCSDRAPIDCIVGLHIQCTWYWSHCLVFWYQYSSVNIFFQPAKEMPEIAGCKHVRNWIIGDI